MAQNLFYGTVFNSFWNCIGAFPQHTEEVDFNLGLYWTICLGCVAVKLDIIIIIIIIIYSMVYSERKQDFNSFRSFEDYLAK